MAVDSIYCTSTPPSLPKELALVAPTLVSQVMLGPVNFDLLSRPMGPYHDDHDGYHLVSCLSPIQMLESAASKNSLEVRIQELENDRENRQVCECMVTVRCPHSLGWPGLLYNHVSACLGSHVNLATGCHKFSQWAYHIILRTS
jgi:hypothetical protein